MAGCAGSAKPVEVAVEVQKEIAVEEEAAVEDEEIEAEGIDSDDQVVILVVDDDYYDRIEWVIEWLAEQGFGVLEENIFEGPFHSSDDQTVSPVGLFLVDTNGSDPQEVASLINGEFGWQDVAATPNFITGDEISVQAESLLTLAIDVGKMSGWDCFTNCLGIENDDVKKCLAICAGVCSGNPAGCAPCILGCGGLSYYTIIKCIWRCS